jgi:5-methylcytosine-specific restriction endonuclease McrA
MAAKKTSRDGKHQAAGAWIRTDKRLAIYLRDRFTCLYCLRDLHDADPADITLDHIKCKSDGGSNHESNLVTACRSCNCSRQDKPLARFAGKETRAHIRRNTKRKLAPYRKLAKAILAGEIDYSAADVETR